MDGTPEVAAKLLQLGLLCASGHDHRRAAFYYVRASRYPGLSPIIKARALLEAARYVFELVPAPPLRAPTNPHYTRAVQWLHTSAGLLKDKPHTFYLRMRAASLLDDVYTAFEDHSAAARTIKAAVDDITMSRDINRPDALKWWLYFRSRAVCNAATSNTTVTRAMHLAVTSSRECAKLQQNLAATAFLLAHCQIAISLPVSDAVNLDPILHQAHQSIKSITPRNHSEQADLAMLKFSFFLLSTLACIREGSLTKAKEQFLARLKASYGDLRHLRKMAVEHGTWQWMPLAILPALTIHTIAVACGTKAVDNTHDPWLFHSTTLGKVGIDVANIGSCDPRSLDTRGLVPRTFNAVVVALLDRAARFKLRSVDLVVAGGLINIAAKMAFVDESSRAELVKLEQRRPYDAAHILPNDLTNAQVMSRCAVMLLLAEYHNLRGRISEAHIATELFKIVSSISSRYTNHLGKELVTDCWQMAASYRTLLEGQSRPTLITQTTSPNVMVAGTASSSLARLDVRFASRHVLAAAWATIGVLYMRSSDVVESRKALEIAHRLLVDRVHTNEQVMVSSMTSLISMELTAETIRDVTWMKMKEAFSSSELIDDPVAMLRLKRLNKKLVVRMGLGEVDVDEAVAEYSRAVSELHGRQERGSASILA